jgi:hypothetical protein
LAFDVPLLKVSLDGSVGAAVVYGNDRWAVLCLTGTGNTEFGRLAAVDHSSELQVLASGTGDYSELWSVVHSAPTVRRVSFAGPSGEVNATELPDGLWLLFAKQSLADTYSVRANSGAHTIGVVIALLSHGRGGRQCAPSILQV